MIYFLERQDTADIKIGFCLRDIKQRAIHWHSEFGAIQILGIMPAKTLKHESAIHKTFAKYHIKTHDSRELFEPHERLLEFIQEFTHQTDETITINTMLDSDIGKYRKARKLTQDQVLQIRKKSYRGMSRKQLMKQYKISYSCVHSIITGNSWRYAGGYIRGYWGTWEFIQKDKWNFPDTRF